MWTVWTADVRAAAQWRGRMIRFTVSYLRGTWWWRYVGVAFGALTVAWPLAAYAARVH